MRFQNDGGPLIAFDAGFADQWHGNTSDDYSNPIPPGSDYERACNARGPADLLQLADGVGVVIGTRDGITTAWWLPLKSGGLYLVGCVFGERARDRDLEGILAQDSSENWQPLGTVDVKSGRLLLLHAASEGATVTIDPAAPHACIEDAVSASLKPGRYEVSCRVVSLEGRGLYTVVKWQPAVRAA